MLYWLMPFDLFSDFRIGVGWIDDLLIAAVCYYLWRYIKTRSEEEYARGYYGEYGNHQSSRGTYGNFGQGWHNTHHGSGAGKRDDGYKDPYEILGVDRGASMDEVKKAYHRKASKYHPDKVSHLGEEFRELAEEKFKEINWAFETLRSEKGS